MATIRGCASPAVLCGGLAVVLVGCASAVTSAGQRSSDDPSVDGVVTVPVVTVSAAGSGSAGPGGTATGSDPETRASSSTLSITSSIVHLTEADSGRLIQVRVGTRIELVLAPSGGSFQPPTADAPTVLHEDAHFGGYPTSTAATTEFTASAPGTARISSITDLACLHSTPACMLPQREFVVAVTVV